MSIEKFSGFIMSYSTENPNQQPNISDFVSNLSVRTASETLVILFIAIATIVWKKQIYPTLSNLSRLIEKDKSHKILTEEKEWDIQQNLKQVMARSECDRATLFFFHNSINFASGHSFLKFSAWIEVCNDESLELLHQYKDCQYSIVSGEINNVKNNLIPYSCHDDISHGKITKSFLIKRQTDAYGFFLIKKQNHPIAFILIEYVKRLHCAIARNVQKMIINTPKRCELADLSEFKRISEIVCG